MKETAGAKKSIKLKVGQIVTATTLRNRFDRHVISVLLSGEYMQEIEREKKQLTRYKITKELSDIAEYNTLRDNKYRTTISAVLDDARSEIESLRDELNEWYENLPESFQNGDKGQMLQDAIDQLEIDMPEADECIANVSLVILPPNNKSTSRSARRDNVCYPLSHLADFAEQEAGEATVSENLKEAYEQLNADVNEVISNLESIEFPGMY